VTRAGTAEERKKKEQEKKDKELQDLEDTVGFTLLLKKISESVGLLIVYSFWLIFSAHIKIIHKNKSLCLTTSNL
jgi:hypothetical protein